MTESTTTTPLAGQLHSPRRCDALLCAIENARDAGKLDVTLAELQSWADTYVAEGLASCTCGLVELRRLAGVYQAAGAVEAQRQATEALQGDVIGLGDYLLLVRWTEGRA